MPLLFISLSILFSVVVGGSVLALLTVMIAAAIAKAEIARRPHRQPVDGPLPRLAVVIPAHNEADVIRATLLSLARQDYDAELFDVIVVADNCTDDTAEIARRIGVTVLDRQHDALRGKGHALNWAINHLLDVDPTPDAYVIVDADTEVATNFLSSLASKIAEIGHPYYALQGRYGVLNANESWRSSLMASAFELINHVRPLGRNRLRLTVGLKGNGMAFSRELLAVATWSGSLTEDIDFGLDLCRNHRIRVVYVPEARVDAVMPSSADAAASQRSRWENGRFQLVRQRAIPLFFEGLRSRNWLLVDAALELMIPPIVELSTLMLIWAVIVVTGAITGALPHSDQWIDAVALTSIGLFVYLIGGLTVAGASTAAYASLLFAPFYAIWKIALYTSRRHRHQRNVWIRTARAPGAHNTGSPLLGLGAESDTDPNRKSTYQKVTK